jgi:hypothetical protein
MEPLVIVKSTVAPSPLPGLLDRVVLPEIDLLILHAAPEPLDKHVVQCAATAIHTDLALPLAEPCSESLTGELGPLVRVADLWASPPEGALQGLQAKSTLQGDRDRPGQHIPTPPVDHRHQVEKPLVQADRRAIRAPHMIHPRKLHPPPEVGINLVSCAGLAQLRLRIEGLNAHLPQQPCHTLTIDRLPLAAEPSGQTTTPIKRGRGVLRIKQPHALQMLRAFTNRLPIQRGACQASQGTLTPQAHLRVPRLNQPTFLLNGHVPLLFSASPTPL